MRVRAAVLHEIQRPFEIEDLDLEGPRAGEVLVRLLAAGVCHSDWHLASGATRHPLPVVPGHEGSGVVEETGPGVTRLRAGDRVILNWAPSCGGCFYCLEDRPCLCSTYVKPIWAGTMLDGSTRLSFRGIPVRHFSGLAAFAERTVVPEVSCVKGTGELGAEVAALIGCAVTTGVGAVLNTARVRAGSAVAVLGAGGVGLSAILAARLAGARAVIAIDRSEGKCRLARGLGADLALVNGPETLERVRAATEGRGADYVFECTGLPAVQEEALAMARPGGVIVLVGIAPMGSGTNLPGALLTREEKTVMGSYYGSASPARDFPRYAELHRAGKLDLDRLVGRRWRLEEINEAYREMLEGSGARGVIVF